MTKRVDYLIIGSGVAGLFFALKVARAGQSVLVITKQSPSETNTNYAQGGIAGVFASTDSFEKHIQDTLIAGDGLCNEGVVRMVVSEGPNRIRELINFGVEFDKDNQGILRLAKEGGHSEHRILHSADATGREIQRALLQACDQHPNIQITDQLFAVDLLTQHHLGQYVNRGNPNITCFGIYALDVRKRKVMKILAKITVLASGGAGNVYASTTNPSVATGDGVAMVLRAKGRIANMEFYQFHPTALYDPGVSPSFLITEALRGKGAVLRSFYDKTEFMYKYDERGSLAPRDIVARAIDNEMKISGSNYVFLDARHIPKEDLLQEFPNIYHKCAEKGINLNEDMIPVVPAAHYMCGGVHVDMRARTSIQNLYAVGEVSCTGLHGANRLASNSLLEAIVYAENAAQDAAQRIENIDFQAEIANWSEKGTQNPEEWVLISHNTQEVQQIMSNYVGIVRSNLRLERAERRINYLYAETEAFYQRTRLSPELCELRNILACAYLIIKCAKIRKESRGLHFSTSYPEKLKRVYETIV
ncbi:MAG: L-aspartate oxidase [Bacteroidia bacterium]|nr:L-aspartate oxidase [Bacteroidia bacterium]